MYETVKNTMKRNMYSRLLSTIVAATVAGPTSCAYLPQAKATELETAQAGLILINPAVKNEKGEVGVRATDAAVALVNATGATGTPAAAGPKPSADSFKIEDGVEMPVVQRGARAGAESYPFSKLNEGQSFFIASSAERPNPAKSLASTVSAASRRYAKRDATTKKVLGYDRKFVIREVEGGARVWRLKLSA